jgi:hypothetical protein
MTIRWKFVELAAALVVASPPTQATVEIVREFVVFELNCRPRLVHVFTSPDVRECVRFQGSQNPHYSKSVGWVLEGV